MIASEYSLSFSNLLEESSLHSVSIQRKGNEISIDDVLMDSYVSCEWYDGIVEEVSFEENNFLVKFLHHIGLSVCLHWPGN